ncbi:MAG: 4-(cytidine 5'-diphospho)-2-C-methyl-D-erythritol kinase [Bacteroidota bacterium]|nr:4-(cytidine 5'-diphospho)-2-C-methyl-D-erythritol kinase [Bacteroidota bacterium]
MIRFPNCKINLGLHILGKRRDGYHNLETVFYPLPIYDALEILPLSSQINHPNISLSGLPVSGDASSNLCLKAWHLVKKDFPQIPAVNIHLHKAIPMGAGLGGGSADGAFALMMLNDIFQLHLSAEALSRHALALGSDCPFFIYNQPSFATGRGEAVQPVAHHLKGYYFYIVNPNIHISTKEAFAQLQHQTHTTPLQNIIEKPIENWKEKLVNDFEEGIVHQHPIIGKIKQQLYNHGAIYAAMSGSGSTVFGIFASNPSSASFPYLFFERIVAAE